MQLATIRAAYADQDDPMRKQGISAIRLSCFVLYCALLVLSCVANAQAQETKHGDLTVVESSGAVKIKLANRWQMPETGMIVSLPATVSTGADGSIRLRQDATTISIAANTAIELLEGTEPGLPLQRVVQDKGSAFYDIAPRGTSRLRVETPWLVAVIKGTQFNVTVASETSTVALFEGRLQIEAPDIGDVVDLHAGQIAKRHKDDPRITVVSMESSEPVSRSNEPAPADKDAQGNGGSVDEDDGIAAVDTGIPQDDGIDLGASGIDSGIDARVDAGAYASLDGGLDPGEAGIGAGLHASTDLAGGDVGIGLEAGLDLGDGGIDAAIDAGVDLAGGDLDLGVAAGLELGDVAMDVGVDAGLDLDDGAIDLALDAGAGVGDVVADVGVDAGLDLDGGDVDLGLDSGVGIGDVVADLDVDAGVDLDAGDIDLGVDGGLDLGGDPVLDVSADAGVDLAGSDVDAGLDVGADIGDVSVDTGLDVGIDLDEGTVETGVDLGAADAGIDLNLGDPGDLIDVDLGLDLLDDDSDSDGEIVEDDDETLPLDPGDLLDLLSL
jgi:hypothetical protein